MQSLISSTRNSVRSSTLIGAAHPLSLTIPKTCNPQNGTCATHMHSRGGSRGGAPGARPPLKLEKIYINIYKYPKHFRASLRNWKKYDFLS